MEILLKILYLGDVVGRPARDFIAKNLGAIRHINGIDLVIADVENATSGAGINREHADQLHAAGIDLMTLGDHVWDRHGFECDIAALDYICRPANLPDECPGSCLVCAKKNGLRIGCCVVLGRQFMKINASCPFKAVEKILKSGDFDVLLVEVHAEATSEKIAMGWNFDGRVAAVIGTHTHVQTADERILPRGTAYITDFGMCGAHESVIGREIPQVLHAMKFSMPQRFEVAANDLRLNGVILTVDCKARTVKKISRFCEKTIAVP
jgi:metallophosphoesterase (TIGR00282 family)